MLTRLCNLLQTTGQVDIVGIAHDGCEAMELAMAHRPDVVLMDIQMPGMNGITATGLLNRRIPGIKVIMCSSHDSPELRQLCFAAGACAFIQKECLQRDLPIVLASSAAPIAPLESP